MNTMKEVIESDKQIIERLTNEVVELRQRLEIYENSDYFEKMVKNTSIYKELMDERNKYKSLYEELIIKFNNLSINKNAVPDINLQYENTNVSIPLPTPSNSVDSKNIISIENNELFNEIKEQNTLLLEQNKSLKFDNEMNSKNILSLNESIKLLEKTIKDQNQKNEDLQKELEKIKKNKNKSKNNNHKKDKSNNEEILLPNNLFEVVYYRHIVNNNLPGYHTAKDIPYLECCGKQWDYRPIGNNGVTCLRCYKTYTLNSDNKLKYNILPDHVIHNENVILNNIKCNNKRCNYISKKEISLCYNCKNIERCEIKEYPMPDKCDKVKETKIALAGECHNSIMYTSGIYDKARKEGLVKNGWEPLINYIKNNKLMEEKQVNVIKNKIIRCGEVKLLYNLDKYKNIQCFIKRLYFDINSLAKLKEDDYHSFKYDLIELLDEEINKNEDNKYDIKENIETIQKCEIKNNIIINEEKITNECCIKCDNILKGEELRNCNKCKDLCIMDDCFKKKSDILGKQIDYCKDHSNEVFSFKFT